MSLVYVAVAGLWRTAALPEVSKSGAYGGQQTDTNRVLFH